MKMSAKAKAALEKIRETFHYEVRGLNPTEYRAVMEEIAADMDAHIGCLDEEQANESEDQR